MPLSLSVVTITVTYAIPAVARTSVPKGTALVSLPTTVFKQHMLFLHFSCLLQSKESKLQAVTCSLMFAGLSSEAAKSQGRPACAVLRATTKLLHFAMPKVEKADHLNELFTESVRSAMTALADSLSDRVMLCACLGALNAHDDIGPPERRNKVCSLITKKVRLKGLHEAIFTMLDQVMQVMWGSISAFEP